MMGGPAAWREEDASPQPSQSPVGLTARPFTQIRHQGRAVKRPTSERKVTTLEDASAKSKHAAIMPTAVGGSGVGILRTGSVFRATGEFFRRWRAGRLLCPAWLGGH